MPCRRNKQGYLQRDVKSPTPDGRRSRDQKPKVIEWTGRGVTGNLGDVSMAAYYQAVSRPSQLL